MRTEVQQGTRQRHARVYGPEVIKNEAREVRARPKQKSCGKASRDLRYRSGRIAESYYDLWVPVAWIWVAFKLELEFTSGLCNMLLLKPSQNSLGQRACPYSALRIRNVPKAPESTGPNSLSSCMLFLEDLEHISSNNRCTWRINPEHEPNLPCNFDEHTCDKPAHAHPFVSASKKASWTRVE